MDIGLVRERLAEAAASISGLNCYGYVPDAVNSPAFLACEVDISFDSVSFRGTSRRGDEVTVTCRLLVSRADDKAGQATLDAYLSPGSATSIKDALEAARGAPGEAALSGACDDFHVTRVQGYRIYDHNGTDYYGAEIVVRCIGDGD